MQILKRTKKQANNGLERYMRCLRISMFAWARASLPKLANAKIRGIGKLKDKNSNQDWQGFNNNLMLNIRRC